MKVGSLLKYPYEIQNFGSILVGSEWVPGYPGSRILHYNVQHKKYVAFGARELKIMKYY